MSKILSVFILAAKTMSFVGHRFYNNGGIDWRDLNSISGDTSKDFDAQASRRSTLNSRERIRVTERSLAAEYASFSFEPGNPFWGPFGRNQWYGATFAWFINVMPSNKFLRVRSTTRSWLGADIPTCALWFAIDNSYVDLIIIVKSMPDKWLRFGCQNENTQYFDHRATRACRARTELSNGFFMRSFRPS